MASVSDVLSVARGEIGYSRWDDPQQGTKYGRWYAELTGAPYYGESGVPYCAMFVSWVFAHAGVRCSGLPGAYCPAMLDDADNDGVTVPVSQARAGDVVYFEWDGDGETDHVGIVVENNGSWLSTIEGNTSSGSSGSQSNGGVVAERQRSYANVCGVVRPYYDSSDDDATDMRQLVVDGVLGPLSVSEWQRQMGTTVTGVVGGQLEGCSRCYPALASVEFDGGGSELMRAVQKMLHVPNPTGVIASGTVSHIQGWLNLGGYDCSSDNAGILGTATAKALQRSLNDGMWADAQEG